MLSCYTCLREGLEEFEDAREIVEGLAEEYAACESPDYIKWASGKENERRGDPRDPRMH